MVVSSDTDWGERKPLAIESDTWVDRSESRVWYVKGNSLRSLRRALRSAKASTPDIVYANSFFNPRYSILPVLLTRFGHFGGARVIVAPRGEFGAAARHYKSRKKNIFVQVARMSGLYRHVIWHASSDDEANDVRRAFPQSRIVVRPNESALPWQALRSDTLPNDTVRLIFISRISEIKGVTILLAALQDIDYSVRLDIYGSAHDPAYLARCEAIASDLPANVEVIFHGSTDNSQVRPLFSTADAFFLPTEQENFGHAIAESLSAGCPVFVADVTPWTDVIHSGGGTVVRSCDVADWHRALKEYCATEPHERHAMKIAAAEAYEAWRAEQEGPSIFDLVLPLH